MATIKLEDLYQQLYRKFLVEIEPQGYKAPFNLAVIAKNGSGMMIDDMLNRDFGMDESGALVTGAGQGFETPIQIMWFDDAGKSGACALDGKVDAPAPKYHLVPQDLHSVH